MNPSVEAMKTLRFVRERMGEDPFRPPDEKARYWWPLAVPTYTAEDLAAAFDVMLSGHTTCWREVAAFEAEFAARFGGGRAAVMVNSGSSANELAARLLAQRIGKGAEVLIPAVTWPTHVWPALRAGLHVRLCDVDPARLCATPATIAAAATRHTRAVWLVHPVGFVCDVPEIRRLAAFRGWALAEDCCDALGGTDPSGAPVGTTTAVGTFSTFLTHHLTTGEGGMILCDRAEADMLRAWRSHGWARGLAAGTARDVLAGKDAGDFRFCAEGWNLRPWEPMAAIGRSQLRRWDAILADRREAVERWEGLHFGHHAAPLRSGPGDSPLGLVARTDGFAPDLIDQLAEAGVEARPVLAGNLARQPAFAGLLGGTEHLPGADAVANSTVYVGCLAGRSDAEWHRLLTAMARVTYRSPISAFTKTE